MKKINLIKDNYFVAFINKLNILGLGHKYPYYIMNIGSWEGQLVNLYFNTKEKMFEERKRLMNVCYKSNELTMFKVIK